MATGIKFDFDAHDTREVAGLMAQIIAHRYVEDNELAQKYQRRNRNLKIEVHEMTPEQLIVELLRREAKRMSL